MTTEERLDQLEKELARTKRRNRRLIPVAVLAIGLVWILGPKVAPAKLDGTVHDEIQAKKFVMVDESGKTRAMLSVLKSQPGLCLYSEKGEARVMLGVLDDGEPGLSLNHEKNIPGALLSVTKDGPILEMFDENGKPSVRLHSTKDDSGLSVHNKKAEARVALGMVEGTPRLGLYNEKGETRAALALSDDDVLALSLYGVKGIPGAILAVTKDGSGAWLFDESGKPLWSAP